MEHPSKTIHLTIPKASPEANKLDIKSCIECRANLPMTDYGRDRTKSDGVHTTCKMCRSDAQASNYTTKYGRVHKLHNREVIRPVRVQNMLVMQHALDLSIVKFECYAFVPHEPAIYKVSFGPSAYGRIMSIRELNVDGSIASPEAGLYGRDFIYGWKDALHIHGELLLILKQKHLRLEFSEVDLLHSKAIIYYLE